MSQRMTLITSPSFVPETKLKNAGSFHALFGNDKPLALEIGCGIGDFVVQQALRRPEHNYIAIDIFNRGCKQTCGRIDESGLDNILMMRAEARYLLHHYLGKDSLAAIYINCPDPWPKKKQRKRRLLNQNFLNLALYSLQPEGDFYFTTDFADYGEAAGELLNQEERLENCHATPYTHDLNGYPVSKYMRRFLDLGQPIYYCHYRKKTGVEIAKPLIDKGFRIRWPGSDQ